MTYIVLIFIIFLIFLIKNLFHISKKLLNISILKIYFYLKENNKKLHKYFLVKKKFKIKK